VIGNGHAGFGRGRWKRTPQGTSPASYLDHLRPRLGPGFIKTNAYAPYPVWVYLNGHEWAKRRAAREGIEFRALDNGFGGCDDAAALAGICASLVSGAGEMAGFAQVKWQSFDGQAGASAVVSSGWSSQRCQAERRRSSARPSAWAPLPMVVSGGSSQSDAGASSRARRRRIAG
jgi:hypothetical protein